ncbi:MAG: SDR family NAD(P)-dependent oxidoreductase [Lachnospiraceae bacterium]|nr:SDR family NAD(P)-dependent oxidoreductase [Lachnospiraceae bacterium]
MKNKCTNGKFMKTKSGKNTTVLVTGASSGIGKACAEIFAKRGYAVTGVSRHCKEGVKRYRGGGSITMARLDVTDEEAVFDFVKEAGGFDIAVLAAGMGVAGAVEDVPTSLVRQQMEINYFGVLNASRALLPWMRRKKDGFICIVGSFGGKVSIPMQAHYSATKYALEALSDAMRMECEPYGVRVSIIEPGDTRTGFTRNRRLYMKDGSVYNDTVRHAVGIMSHDEKNGDSPMLSARQVYRMSQMPNPPARVVIGWKYKLLWQAVKFMPDALREKIIKGLYLG